MKFVDYSHMGELSERDRQAGIRRFHRKRRESEQTYDMRTRYEKREAKWAPSAPPTTKRVRAADTVREWTLTGTWGSGHHNVQALARTGQVGDPSRREAASNLAKAMREYMAKHALRAPGKPAHSRDVTTLYRGVRGASLRATLQNTGRLADAGFMAFSRKLEKAEAFGETIFALDISDIPRGTPYVWFTDNTRNAKAGRAVKTEHEGEHEVLLSPGVLVTKGPCVVRKQASAVWGGPSTVVCPVKYLAG